MRRPVFNDGHYTFASGWDYQQDIFESEVSERLLAVVDSAGVVSGLVPTDSSAPGSLSITISPGLAYDFTGDRIKATSSTVITGIGSSHVNKWLVVENSASGTHYEAHPYTGELQATRSVDVAGFSFVTGTTNTQVKLAKVTSIGSTAVMSQTQGTNRDILTYPKSSPFYVIGPAGDPVAEYTGDDASPFNAAVSDLHAAGKTGATFIVRPGTYVVDGGSPIVVTGLTSLRIIGDGDATHISGKTYGFSQTVMRVDDVLDLSIEHIKFTHRAADPLNEGGSPLMMISNVRSFYFAHSSINDHSPYTTFGDSTGITFISGVQHAVVENCLINQGNSQRPVSWYGMSNYRSNDSFTMQDCKIEASWMIEVANPCNNFKFIFNDAINGVGQLLIGRSPVNDVLATEAAQPLGQMVVAENTFAYTQLNANVSGSQVLGNSFSLPHQVKLGYGPGLATHASYSIVAGNHFNWSMSDITQMVVDSCTGVIVKNNIFAWPPAEADPAIFGTYLMGDTKGCVVDGNIFSGFTYPIKVDATDSGSWYTTGVNYTSNKVIT